MSAARGGEFALIERYLSRLGADRPDVPLGPGDDAALLDPGARRVLVAVASAGGTQAPEAAACEPLATAIEALRDAGAEPAWASLALSLAAADEDWLRRFAAALDRACREAGVQVVGGDTTAGGTAVTLFVSGLLPAAVLSGQDSGDAPR